MLPIVTVCATPVSSASEFFPFLLLLIPISGFLPFQYKVFKLLGRAERLLCADLSSCSRWGWPPSSWYVAASIDGWRWQRQSFNAVEDCGEQLPSDSHFGKLERHIFRVPRDRVITKTFWSFPLQFSTPYGKWQVASSHRSFTPSADGSPGYETSVGQTEGAKGGLIWC